MPDITMCHGENCPLKEKCYRYTAKPNRYFQSFFQEPPYQEGKCVFFEDNEDNEDKAKIEEAIQIAESHISFENLY